MSNIMIEQLENDATLNDVMEKIKEIKAVNESIKDRLMNVVVDNGVEVNEADTIQSLVGHIEELLASPLPPCFRTEPGNPWGSELHAKIRYRDRDGKDRVVYSKASNSGYPCYNDKTDILYFATKATYVKGYVYENNQWNAIGEAYYGYLVDGSELASVYSNSVDIPYHSNATNPGKLWKAKTNY